VLADLACAIADGAEVISDFRVMCDQEDLFGLVASVPTAWRTLAEIAGGGELALGRITAAINAARRRAWAAAATRHGALPGIPIADKTLGGVTGIRLTRRSVTGGKPTSRRTSFPATKRGDRRGPHHWPDVRPCRCTQLA
jgi:hypothetical protein